MSKFLGILQPIAELLERKNQDYGNSFDQLRERYGPVGFYIRVADKLNRIEQLDSNPAQVKSESIEDTLRDIIGYVTLEINYRMKKKPELVVSGPDTEQGIVKCRGKNCYRREITTKKKMKECLMASLAINPDFSECVWNAKGIRDVYK